MKTKALIRYSLVLCLGGLLGYSLRDSKRDPPGAGTANDTRHMLHLFPSGSNGLLLQEDDFELTPYIVPEKEHVRKAHRDTTSL